MGITVDGCIRLLTLYADLIPEKLETVFNELEETSSARVVVELRERMLGLISQLCERAKARLS